MKDNFLNKKIKYFYWDSLSWIAAICVFVFAITNFIDIRIKGVPLVYWLSLVPSFVDRGCIWQFFTYMFVHGSPVHLLLNVYALFAFGRAYEKNFGTGEFLVLFFSTGILGGLLSYLIYKFTGLNYVAVMGASGAVYGLLFIQSVLFPRLRVLLFFFLPVKLPVAVLLFIIIEIVSQLTGSGASVAHLVHLSSIAVAWAYSIFRFRISPWKVWKDNI